MLPAGNPAPDRGRCFAPTDARLVHSAGKATVMPLGQRFFRASRRERGDRSGWAATKALTQDQARSLARFRLPGLHPAIYDGDTETERRWQATTSQWPIMHAVTYGVSRDQMMARHKANHIQVAYALSAADADRALYAKAAMAEGLGLDVFVCGTRKNDRSW